MYKRTEVKIGDIYGVMGEEATLAERGFPEEVSHTMKIRLTLSTSGRSKSDEHEAVSNA